MYPSNVVSPGGRREAIAPLHTGDEGKALTQMARVSGQVIEDRANTPVAGADVFVVIDGDLSATAGPLTASVTDQDGRYHLDAVPAGRYRIAAHKAGFVPPMEPSMMQMFEVSDGQALDGLTVTLRRGGAITGRALDPLGRPLAEAGVMVWLKRLHSGDRPTGMASSGAPLLMPFGQSQTDRLGEFRISGLLPGEYVIAANPRTDFGGDASSSPATTIVTSTFYPGTADVSAAQPVTVPPDETVSDLTIRLVIVPAFQVSGTVIDEAGTPAANLMVMLMDGRRGTDSFLSLVMGPRGMCQSDASGRFTFGEVPAGSYTLSAHGAGGFFGITDDFIIDGGGTPRVCPGLPRPAPAPAPGTLEVIVENANVSDLRIIVQNETDRWRES